MLAPIVQRQLSVPVIDRDTISEPEMKVDAEFDSGLRGKDLNPRPPGYEPGELPDCSTPPAHSTHLLPCWSMALAEKDFAPVAALLLAGTNLSGSGSFP
jgi:hypothetical protein